MTFKTPRFDWNDWDEFDLEEDEENDDPERIEEKLRQFGLDSDDGDDSILCPMCDTEIDFDTGYCPVCKECVV